MDTLQPPGPVHGVKAASYGTAQNPTRDNLPKPAVPRVVTPPDFIVDDSRVAEDRLHDQQWRDAVGLGLLHNAADAINLDGP